MKKTAALLLSIAMAASTILTTSCSKKSSSDETSSSGSNITFGGSEGTGSEPSGTAPAVKVPKGEVVITKTDPSVDVFDDTSLEWQYDLAFPDWQDRSMYGANNRLGFYGYRDQGKVYVRPADGAGFAAAFPARPVSGPKEKNRAFRNCIGGGSQWFKSLFSLLFPAAPPGRSAGLFYPVRRGAGRDARF